MITAEQLDKFTDEQLAEMVAAHERDLQLMRNARRAGLFITREISQGVADQAAAILRRRADARRVVKVK